MRVRRHLSPPEPSDKAAGVVVARYFGYAELLVVCRLEGRLLQSTFVCDGLSIIRSNIGCEPISFPVLRRSAGHGLSKERIEHGLAVEACFEIDIDDGLVLTLGIGEYALRVLYTVAVNELIKMNVEAGMVSYRI